MNTKTWTSRAWFFAGIAVFCGVGVGPARAKAEIKKTIAVAPIQWSVGTVSWISGEALQAQMISELSNTGRYRVVERENLDGMLKEQDLATEGRMRGGSGAETGELEGAQLMIKPVITDAEATESSGRSGSFKGFGMGKSKTVYKITMDVRIYDTSTGMILDTATVSAEQVKKGESGSGGVGGLGFGGNKDAGGDTTGDITRQLINDALKAIDKQAETIAWKSKVVLAKGDKIVIRGGERDGLEAGMKFKVFKLGEPIVDEDSGEVLDAGEETEVATIELTEVKDKVAYAKKITGDQPEKGNTVAWINEG